ncbi:TPA: adenosine deaminase [Klebsiella pneumoniae]|nr:adenosine deaminase [Klebsiella pneumoniae]
MDLYEARMMDKGELHVHLNGLVSTQVIRGVLEKNIIKMPEHFNIDTDLNVTHPARSLVDYLKPWQFLRLIPASHFDLSIMIESAFSNLIAENIKFVELRNSIIYIALLNNISVSEALKWVLDDIDFFSRKFNIQAGLILTITRGEYAPEHLRSLLGAYKSLGCPAGVIGLDLAGNEDITPPPETASLFRSAKDKYGLGITIHAGETGNADNIRNAIISYGADRIGHGTAVIRSPEIMDLIRERDICIEVCPISNRLTGAVSDIDPHPVGEMINHNIPFVICSDNPAIHRSSLSEDYVAFMQETKNFIVMDNMYETQKRYSFLKGVK